MYEFQREMVKNKPRMGWILSIPQIFSRTNENNIKKKDSNFEDRERLVNSSLHGVSPTQNT
jgi:hypothetical protein